MFLSYPDIDECASDPCVNALSCDNGVDSFVCQCIGGYNGVHCEHSELSVIFASHILQQLRTATAAAEETSVH